MSTAIAEADQVSKKRKHESDVKDSKRKKHKQDGSSIASPRTVEDDTPKAKKKKRRDRDEEDRDKHQNHSNETSEATLLPVNGIVESSDTVKAEKARMRKKRRKDTQEEETRSSAHYEGETLVSTSQPDENATSAQYFQDAEDTTTGTALQDEILQSKDKQRLISDTKTCFHSVRMSMYLPVPAIASTSHVSALLTVHLSPLLLTFFPPAGGVILSYHNPIISARPEPGPSRPLIPPTDGDVSAADDAILCKVGEEFGASWVWLTVTFLVFKPEPGDQLEGWANVMAEGFIGLVSYNYFQTSISRNRIPKAWTWNGPSRQETKQRKILRKGKLKDNDEADQHIVVYSQDTLVSRDDDAVYGSAGYFVDENEIQVTEDLEFKVVDLEMIKAQERGRMFALQLEGTLLDDQEEQQVREEERVKWETRANKNRVRLRRPGTPLMSGGLPTHSRAGSVMSTP